MSAGVEIAKALDTSVDDKELSEALAAEAARFHKIEEAKREAASSSSAQSSGSGQEEPRPKVSGAQVREDGGDQDGDNSTRLATLAVQFQGGPPLSRPCVDCGLNTGRYCDGDEYFDVGFGGYACLASNANMHAFD